jgi:hypothetical protein
MEEVTAYMVVAPAAYRECCASGVTRVPRRVVCFAYFEKLHKLLAAMPVPQGDDDSGGPRAPWMLGKGSTELMEASIHADSGTPWVGALCSDDPDFDAIAMACSIGVAFLAEIKVFTQHFSTKREYAAKDVLGFKLVGIVHYAAHFRGTPLEGTGQSTVNSLLGAHFALIRYGNYFTLKDEESLFLFNKDERGLIHGVNGRVYHPQMPAELVKALERRLYRKVHPIKELGVEENDPKDNHYPKRSRKHDAEAHSDDIFCYAFNPRNVRRLDDGNLEGDFGPSNKAYTKHHSTKLARYYMGFERERNKKKRRAHGWLKPWLFGALRRVAGGTYQKDCMHYIDDFSKLETMIGEVFRARGVLLPSVCMPAPVATQKT